MGTVAQDPVLECERAEMRESFIRDTTTTAVDDRWFDNVQNLKRKKAR